MRQTLTEPQKLWIEALRSGEYKQTTLTLQNHDGFCCLGVACDIARQHGVRVRTTPDGLISGADLLGQSDVLDWIGLRHALGVPLDDTKFSPLTDLNDRHHLSFDAIADELEYNPKEYFNPPNPNQDK